MPNKNRTLFRSAVRALALEPRLLFDGAGAVAVVDNVDTSHDNSSQHQDAPVADARPQEAMESGAASGVLLIIDARVADHQSLLADLPANVTVRVIGNDESGLGVIGEELAKGGTFDAIHIVSHGTLGNLTLGSDSINKDSLSSHSAELQSWAANLSADADILLYGCEIAQGEQGQVFIDELAHLTGADIAASTNATGNAEKGGDWVLEANSGSIEAGIVLSDVAIAGYNDLLAATAITDSNAEMPRVTAEDTPLAINGLSVAGGAGNTITLTITTIDGTANLGNTTGLTVVGNDSSAITVTGTIANVNAALGALAYKPADNQNSSTSDFTPSITLAVTNGGAGSLSVTNISVSAVNDAPNLSTKINLVVSEGGSNVPFSLAQLASSDAALDVDIATGQQVIGQQMVVINSLPSQGTLTYLGGAVAIGQVIPVSNLGELKYTHNGADIASNATDGFNVTVSDGGGGQTAGTIGITITPVNQAPTISGSPTLIEGQVKVVAPTISLGDTADTLATSTVEITAVNNGGQGTLFFDANNDNVVDAGEAIAANRVFTAAEAADLGTKLKFKQDDTEPNLPAGVSKPTYTIKVTDAGGGQGSALSATQTITIDVLANNDDPTLTNIHATSGTALPISEGVTTVITPGMLAIADVDRNPANINTTTPPDQLVYTIGTRPTQGEIQLFVGGAVGPASDGWIVLGDDGRFTQAQVIAGNVRYYQTTDVVVDTLDNFTFTVRDSAFGFDVWTDPANPTGGREGGVRDTLTGLIATQTFNFNIAANNNPHVNTYTGDPRPATQGYGGSNMTYSFVAVVPTPGNGAATWNEANVGAGGGYPITQSMLEYTITRSDDNGTPAPGDDVSVVVPPEETVYTLTSQPTNGVIQRFVGGAWQNIPTNGQFTQAEINTGTTVRFVHDGGEDHSATFGYTVSDGTPNKFEGTFSIDVTPTNDRPTAAGSASAQVREGDGSIGANTDSVIRLGTAELGMTDADLSLDPAKQIGEGAKDFLWFQVTAQPTDGVPTPRGELQRWNGSAWVAVTPGDWLSSSLLTAPADGATSGLRYVHDGSEPLAYTGGPKVTFSYTVRDDLADPNDPFAVTSSAVIPADITGSAQSNLSAAATVTINIIPVNDAPLIADKPSELDPSIPATIVNGGATTGVNQVLTGVLEGSTTPITSAHLTAVDRDNTTEQRQYRITQTTTQGTLLLNGAALGVGSTFTQADIDTNKVAYRHNGTEITAATTDGLGTYNDKFHFVVNDGVLEDSGDATNNNVFLITLAPANDKPTVTAPVGPITIDSATAANNPVTGFSVDDPDLANPDTSTDFVQVTVRLQNSGGTPVTDYATGFAGAGVSIKATTTGLTVTQDGTNNILQFQGTKAQVNAALEGLTVTFANDANAIYKLEVIVDDRTRDGITGALVTTGNDANGGEVNQPATPGGATTSVVGGEYDWKTDIVDPASGNIASKTVDLRASSINDVPVFTGPGSFTVNEDVRSKVDGFVVTDAESAAFDTPVTVTISVPIGQGTLDIGNTGVQSSVTPSGGKAVTISGDTTRSITLTGRAADIQAVLNGRNVANNAADANTGLHYTSSLHANHDQNAGAAEDVTLTLTFSEGASAIGDDVGSGSVANVVTDIVTGLTITAINDAPTVATGSGSIAISGSGINSVNGFVVNDVDANNGYADGESDGVIQVTVRVLNELGTPLTEANYLALGITFGSSTPGAVTVDGILNGNTTALELRGTRAVINTYLAGLQVTFANIGVSNLDTTYKVEVIADDRLRNGAGTLTADANGGANNQQVNLPAVPNTDTFDPYTTKVPDYNVYNVTSGTRDLFISAINDPGKITATNVTVNEGSATLDLTGANANFSLDDSDDNGATTMEVTVTVGAGTITAVTGSGGAIAGLNSSTITITGATEAQINAYLKAITVTFPDADGAGAATAADWNGTFDVTVVYNDKGNTGTRPSSLAGDSEDPRSGNGDYAYADDDTNHLITTRIITVTVSGVNDAPLRTVATVTLPAGTEDTDGGAGDTITNLFGSAFSDAKDNIGGNGSTAGTFAGIAITSNNAIAAQGVWQYSTDGGTSWTALPPVSATGALLLAADAKLRFDPADNFHGTPGGLETRLIDNSGAAFASGDTDDVAGVKSGGNTRYSDASNAVALNTTVANVNDRPTGTNATLPATTEDTSNPAGTLVSALDFGYADTTDDQTAITGGGDAKTSLGGIAIVGNSENSVTEGVWQYNDNAGSGWVAVGSRTDATALVMTSTSSLRFVPVANFNGTPTGSLSVRVADTAQVFGTNNDISAAVALGQTSTWSEVIALGTLVNPLNDAPTMTHTATNPTVTENGSTGAATSIDPVALLTPGAVADLDLDSTPGLDAAIFGTGSITVTLTDGIAGDKLAIDPLVIAGIATTTGGTGATPLVITLTNTATVAQVSAILAAVQYSNTSDNPTNFGTDLERNYTVVLSDGNNEQAGGKNAGGPDPLTVSQSGTITLVAANDPPIATDNSNSVTEDSGTPATGNVRTDGIADSDPDNVIGELSISGIRTGNELAGGVMTPISAGTNSTTGTVITGLYGTLTLGADGSYSYVLDNGNAAVNALQDGQTLTEVFTYTLRDPDNATDTAALTITINGHTDGVPQIGANDGNGSATGQATVFEKGLTSASDNSETTTGTLTVKAPDGIKTVTIGGTTITVAELQAIQAGSNPPVSIDTGEGTLLITGITVVTGAPEAPTEANVTYSYTLKVQQDQPGATESSDIIALEVTDTKATPTTATGTLTVQIIDDTPTAVADINTAAQGVTLTVTAANGVLKNDSSGADGWAPSGAVVGVVAGNTGTPTTDVGSSIAGSYGTLILQADGSYSYLVTDTSGVANRQDVFTYTVRDSDGDQTTTTLTININNPPVANDDTRTTPEDTPITGNIVTGSGGDVADSDPEGDTLAVTQIVIGGTPYTVPGDGSTTTVNIPGKGTLVIDKTGSYTFTPTADWHGIVPPITYTVTDGNGGFDTAELNITVTPVVDIADDKTSTTSGIPVTINVLPNDSFENSDRVVTSVTQATNGTVSFKPDGSITYTPAPSFFGTDTFTYTVTSGGVTETATVTVDVTAENPPVQPIAPMGNGDPIRSPLDGPRLQSTNALLGSPVTLDAGPYYANERFDDVRRMQLPFHPIVYVNREVQAAQAERAHDDSRSFSDTRAFRLGEQRLTSQSLELGMDPNLFVTHAIRDSQLQSRALNNMVDGRYGRADLSSEGDIQQTSLFREPVKSLAELLKERKKQQSIQLDTEEAGSANAATPDADETPRNAEQTQAMPTERTQNIGRSGSPSFADQLRTGAGRLPLAQSNR